MIQTLSDKLLEVLGAYEGSGQPFVSVLDYHTLDSTGYPYLTFEPVGFEWEVLDSCNNERTYQFQILIFQEVTETGWRKEAKEIMSKAIHDVIGILDSNYTLDGTAIMVTPINWSITPVDLNSGKWFVWEIIVNIRTTEFIK